jgi:hypothetical protein
MKMKRMRRKTKKMSTYLKRTVRMNLRWTQKGSALMVPYMHHQVAEKK